STLPVAPARAFSSFPPRRSSDLDPPHCRHSRLGDLVPVDGRARKTVHKNRPCDLGSVRARTGVATVRLPKEILLRPVELARHGRSEEHTSDSSHVSISYAVCCFE